MNELRLARKTISILLKDWVHYPNRLVMDIFLMFSRYGILMILYWYVFNLRGGSIANTTFAPVAWSVFFYFAFMTFRPRNIAREIMTDVQSGKVELFFSKPVSYIWHKIWWQIGMGSYPFAVMAVAGSLVLFAIVGIPSSMTAPIFVPTLILAFVGGSALSLLLYSIVGLTAFWIEDAKPVFWMIDKSIMILGGSYLPVAMFPPLMYKIAIYSPLGASQLVTHTVLDSWKNEWPILIAIQMAWVIVMFFAVWFIFSKARKNVSINGG